MALGRKCFQQSLQCWWLPRYNGGRKHIKASFRLGDVVQLVELLPSTQEALGSVPSSMLTGGDACL